MKSSLKITDDIKLPKRYLIQCNTNSYFSLKEWLKANIDSQVKNFDNFNSFPTIGLDKTIYIAEDTKFQYYWDGSNYVQLTTDLSAYVPYNGANQNVDLGEFGVDVGFVKLDTTPTNTPTTQGTISWDVDDNTIKAVLNGYSMKIGEDQFYPVKNQSGNNIVKGTAVRFAGTSGMSGRLLIEPFIANGSFPSSVFMGVTAENINNGEDGKVLWFGRIRGINTNALGVNGDILYASTSVVGGFQTAVPTAPNNIVQVAAIVNNSVNQGVIFVRPTFSSNINKEEGVLITAPLDKQVLQYNSSNGLWQNGVDLNLATFTVDLLDELLLDIIAPDDLKINSTEVINGTGVVTIKVNNVAYTLGSLITKGDIITVEVDDESAVNLYVRYE
jgi:hypothetical protein